MRWFLFAAAALVIHVEAVAAADTLSEARALYKQGQFAKAAQKYTEAAIERPTDPAVYWNMGFAFRKIGRSSDALAAFERAGKLDPTHSFASGPGKYEHIVALTRKQIQPASQRPGKAPARRKTGSDALAEIPEVVGVKRGPVYVQEPNWARVNVAYLTGVAEELKRSSGKPVHFLVTSTAYRGRQLARYATTIYSAARLDNAWLIIASRNGAAAVSGPTSKPVVAAVPSKAASAVRAGDAAGGLEQLARALVK